MQRLETLDRGIVYFQSLVLDTNLCQAIASFWELGLAFIFLGTALS